MTEPKRWTIFKRRGEWDDVIVGPDVGSPGVGEPVVPLADFDRLRDERDEMIRVSAANIATTQRNMDELRRVAGVLADALRNNAPCYCDHPLRAGLPPFSRCSALAVFDTLTEEKTDE